MNGASRHDDAVPALVPRAVPAVVGAQDAVGERTLADLLDERRRRDPEKTWLVFEARDGAVSEWSYARFADDVARAAGGLAALGVGHGDRVLLHLRNGPEFLITWFAAASIGAVIVPSNVANTASEVAFLVERAGTRVAVVDPATTAVAAGIESVFVARDGPVPDGMRPFADLLAAEPAARGPVASTDLHQILFTSGTTSAPKGVMVTHANALWSGIRMGLGMGLEPGDRCLTALPLFHVNAQSVTVLAALTVGASVVLLEAFEAAKYFEQVRRHGATATSLVAAQSTALLAQPARDDDREHRIRRTGHAINVPDAAKDELERRFGLELINIYGLSEACETVAMSPLHGPQRWPAVGLPALDRRVRVVVPGSDDDDVAVGEVGEILVHGVPGRTVMAGYFGDPEATARTVVDGWVHTGDLGRFDDHGYLYFVDRTKNIVKVAGQNVSATEVEEVIAAHPDVVEAAVIAIAHPTRGETPKAFVVASAPMTADDVLAHCAARLAKFKLPGAVEFLDALPRTSVGKLAKAELTARERDAR